MIDSFIPDFDFVRVFVEPWRDHGRHFIWIALMGFLITTACGLVGNYLILRRMALVGDAISHSVLPGLAVGFIVLNIWAGGSSHDGEIQSLSHHPVHTWKPLAMFLGALGAGALTTLLIELIHKKTRVKQDSAIGIVFSTLFALGVILICLFADKVDLDQECVLYGEIAFVPLKPFTTWFGVSIAPPDVIRMAGITLLTILLISLFYKELLVSSFDPALAASMGINATVVHYGLMAILSLVVVSAFESAGAILVVAMLILPGATASLLSQRLPTMMCFSMVQAAITSILGIHLAVWLRCSIAAAMVVVGALLFLLAWIFNSQAGLLQRLKPHTRDQTSPRPEIQQLAQQT